MKDAEVPQDRQHNLAGQRKAVYAVDENGDYHVIPSSGWEAEEVVLDQAVAAFDAQALDAWHATRAGQVAPLLYHMYAARMDPLVLAQATGFFRWQVRRHLKPAVFARLPRRKLERYAEALGLDLEALQTLPENATHE